MSFDCTKTKLQDGSVDGKDKLVTALQKGLQKLGFYLRAHDDGASLKVDGKFKQYTKEAVQDFQKSVGLKDNGVFTGDTCVKFNEKVYGTKKNDTDNTTTQKADNKTVKNTTKKEVVIDAKKYNFVDLPLANLTIDTLHFIAEEVNEKNAFGSSNQWKTVELMNDYTVHYPAHSQPTTYDITCYMHFKDFNKIRNGLKLLQNKKECRVISKLCDIGFYTVMFDKTYFKPDLWKVTITISKVGS